MVRHPQTRALRFIRALASLFGQGSAFFNFARWSAFLEAAPRRLLFLLCTMYVDDGQLTDLAAAKGSGQQLIHDFFEEIGAGLKEAKREWMKQLGLFLGVEHDLTALPVKRTIAFWPREGIIAEIRRWIAEFRSTRKCTPAQAAKFCGLNGFAAQAEYGQLGRAAMHSFKQRQYFDQRPWNLSNAMERAIDFIEMLLVSSWSGECP